MTSARSFRDPTGYVVDASGRVLRVVVDPQAAERLLPILQLGAVERAVTDGRLVSSRIVPEEEWRELPMLAGLASPPLVLEHERIAFPSYPYEWPPEMLHAAGQLTLDLALALLEEGHGLKDATPYNVLFKGPRPVFVDVASIEPRDPDDYTWLPQAQFARTFLLPLLACRDLGLALSGPALAKRDGLEPEDLYRMIGPLRRLRSPYLGLVSLPTWLARASRKRGATLYQERRGGHSERSRFIVSALLRRLTHTLDRLPPGGMRRSAWSTYMDADLSYTDAAFGQKEAFVRSVLADQRPTSVLDVGCNTGHFSALAARSGASVVAIDSDPVVVGEAWRRASADGLGILPLVVDLSRPSPGIGWRNAECASFLDRAQGGFDLVLMLALVHHLLVTERVPLDAIVEIAAELTRDSVIVEYVGPDDRCFRQITRGRASLHDSLSPAVFEAAFLRHFRIARSEPVQGSDRRLYLMTRGA